MSCQGKPIEMQDLRTAEQKQMMEKFAPLLFTLASQGATPFLHQLSAPPDKGMFDAMNMMSMVGTGKPYTWGGMQTGAYPSAGGGVNLPAWNYDWTDPTRGEDTVEKDQLVDPHKQKVIYKPGYDPYAPWTPDPEGVKKKA